MRLAILAACLAAVCLAGSPKGEIAGRVVSVRDGDTIEILAEGKAIRIRLYGIDCPEKKQPYGSAAKKLTSELAFGKPVRARVVELDRYGRSVAEVFLPDGRSLNRELVKAGLAWWYRRYAPDDLELARLEQKAQDQRAGLWEQPGPLPPWSFRYGLKKEAVAAQ